MVDNKEDTMKIRIIKSILSIYGAMVPGTIITVSEHIAKNWIKDKIAVPAEPMAVPKGMYWCDKCLSLHKLVSPKGIRHLKHSAEPRPEMLPSEPKAGVPTS